MEIKLKSLLIIILSLLFSKAGTAQSAEYCGTVATALNAPLIQQGDGIYLTAHGTLRALVVFVRFPDDNTESNHWPASGFPNFTDTFIDPSTTTVNSSNFVNITNYYKEMSLNQFNVVGDVVEVVAPNPSSYYGAGSVKNRYLATKDVLEHIDNNTSINFSDYDNWTRNSNYNHVNSPDSVVDMILMIWKGTWFSNDWRGEASMGSSTGSLLVDNGNTEIKFGFWGDGSGVTVHDNSSSTTLLNTVRHELGHWILGGGHPYNNDPQNRISSILQWAEPQAISVSAPERERLGWITVPEITSFQSSFLDDFITTGEAFKYDVTPSNSTDDEYYYITNHQQISMYDNTTHNTVDKGIVILHDENSESNTENNRYLISDGDWDWNHVGQMVNPWDVNKMIPIFERSDINRAGQNFATKIFATGFGDSWLYALRDQNTGVTTTTTYFRGTNLKSTYSVSSRPILSEITNPMTKNWSGASVPFALKVKSKSGNKLYFDAYTNYNPYSITENTTWDGQIFLDDNVTVQSGSKLTIKPNTEVYVANGKAINVYGELYADGVTFTAMSNNWNGITYMSGSDGEIENSTIEKVNSYGGAALRIYTNNHIEIHNNIIQNLTGAASGINLTNADNVYIYDNRIENTSNNGIYAYNSNPRIFDNFIKNFTNSGIHATGYSSAVLSAISGSNYVGENTISGGKYGLQIGSYSYLNAGSSSSFASQNRIMMQSGSGWAHVYSSSSYSNTAQYNFYKHYNSSSTSPVTSGSGSISVYPWLYTDPNPGAGGYKVLVSEKTQGEDQILLEQAIMARLAENYPETERLLNEIISSSSEEGVINQSLFEYAWLAQLSKDDTFLTKLEELEPIFENTALEPISKVALAKVFYSRNKYDKALKFLDKVIEKYPNAEDTRPALILASYIAADAGYHSRANDYYELANNRNFKLKGVEGDLLELQYYITNSSVPENQNTELDDLDSENPSAVKLSNYPNPFNPTTNIRYSIPDRSEVSLKVYDLLGRDVAVLVNEVKESGEYSINFDASSLSSGVYIYQLSINGEAITKRMTLIK